MTARVAQMVPVVFARLIDDGVLRVAAARYDERSFGNEVVTLHARDWYVVIETDRDVLNADIGALRDGAAVDGTLHDLGAVCNALGLTYPGGLASLPGIEACIREHRAALDAVFADDALDATLQRIRTLEREERARHNRGREARS